eukprot:1122601-Pyramimonas_sp.AAC.2
MGVVAVGRVPAVVALTRAIGERNRRERRCTSRDRALVGETFTFSAVSCSFCSLGAKAGSSLRGVRRPLAMPSFTMTFMPALWAASRESPGMCSAQDQR